MNSDINTDSFESRNLSEGNDRKQTASSKSIWQPLRRCLWFSSITLLSATSSAIPCNTGVTGAAATCGVPLLAPGSPDLHWDVTYAAPSGPLIAAPPVVFGEAYANVNSGIWLPNSASPVSGWIAPNLTAGEALIGGQYVYHTTFSGADPFGGRYLSDNELMGVFLNNLLIAGFPVNSPSAGSSIWTSFSIFGGLNAAVNTLDFVVRNRGVGGVDANSTVTGFRAEFIPEPPAWLLVGLGLVGIAMSRKNGRNHDR